MAKRAVSASPAAKKAGGKSADMKTTPTQKSVSAFIARVDYDQRRKEAEALVEIMQTVTGDKPVMWGPSIIGFGAYHYRYDSGREGDFFLVGFSPRKSNMALYLLGSIDDDDPLLEKLGKFKRARSCLYVNKLDDIDAATLRKLIRKSYDRTAKRWRA